jgi:hypothetical protein
MRIRIQREVAVPASAARVWEYVTDWPRQREWVPLTRTEIVDGPGDVVGGRIRAWTGIGRVGFWDPMTITRFDRSPDGGGRCEVLHTGRVVRGEGEFRVVAEDADRCRFVWVEVVPLPFGRLGGIGWRLVRPLIERGVDRGLRRLSTRFDPR